MKIKFRIISVVLVSLLALTFSCKKEVPKVIPSISSSAPTNITSSTAVSGGRISTDGGARVTSRGVCWSVTQNPTISDNKTSDGTGIGNFTSSISGLTPSTKYYVRAYATNSVGTVYGNEISFFTLSGIIFNPNLTYGTVTDIEGNVYKTIVIGTQTWMAENLKTTKYRNGDSIGTTTLDLGYPYNLPTYIYQWAYAGNESNVATYGRLYTFNAASDSRNICPTGWHLSTKGEWFTLITFLGGYSSAGGKLKETGTTHWQGFNTGATNSSGFTALPGGLRYDVKFEGIGGAGIWWGPDVVGTESRSIKSNSPTIDRGDGHSNHGYSVRCVKDN